jgi:pyridoxine kinase
MMRNHVATLLAGARETVLFEHQRVETPAKGTGDLFAALVLARRLKGHGIAKATEMALASLFEIVARTARAGGTELMLPAFQDSLVTPLAQIVARRLGARAPG